MTNAVVAYGAGLLFLAAGVYALYLIWETYT